MKKNFDKPFSRFYDEPDVDSAWDSMRKVLDAQLPVERRDRSRRSIIYYITAAAMLLLLLAALVVNKTFYFNEHNYSEIPKNGGHIDNAVNKRIERKNDPILLSKKGNIDMNGAGNIATTLPTITNKPDKEKTVDMQILKHKNTYRYKEASHIISSLSSMQNQSENYYGSNSVLENENDNLILLPAKSRTEINVAVRENKLVPVIHALPLRDTLATIFHSATIDDRKKRQLKKIGFDIGLYHNVGSTYKAIYPMVAVTKSLSKKSFVSLGVGFNSQININNFAPKEFTVINDTTNQVYFTLVQKNISKAVYIDLPVAIYYNVNNRISVNAGVQLSVLQKVKIKSVQSTFDFQSDLSQLLPTRVYTSTSSYTPNTVYAQDYTFLKTNGRFIAGVGYKLKDIAIKFQYAKSFSPNYNFTDFDGTQSLKKLSSFTIGINYRVR